jgi:hypothetical protein
MLPAYERTDTTVRRIDGAETVRVARTPHQALGIRGHELPMMVEQSPIGTERQDRVVERATAWSRIDTFDDADDKRHAGVACNRA